MDTNKESEVEDKELVKPGEEVLLDEGHRPEVDAEDGAGADTDQNAQDSQQSYLKLKCNIGVLKKGNL